VPRALKHMSSEVPADKLRSTVQSVLQKVHQSSDAVGAEDPQLEQLLDEILTSDKASSSQNVSRLKSSSAFFNRADTMEVSSILSALTSPIEYYTNILMHRTEIRFKLKTLQLDAPSRAKLETEHLSFAHRTYFQTPLAQP
jgi:hypothetical protein